MNHPLINVTYYGLAITVVRALGGDVSYFDGNSIVVFALKFDLLFFELGIAALIWLIVRRLSGKVWALVSVAIYYLTPGVFVVSAWWGQNDATYTFFIVFAVWMLAQKRYRWAWVLYALAWLCKFQSVMFLPVFGVYSLSRGKWRSTFEGGILFSMVILGGLLPFLINSGVSALNPYITSVNLFPYITTNAHNLWFWVSGSSPTALLDSLPLWGSISYAQAGAVLLIVGTGALILRTVQVEEKNDVYLLFATANLIFYFFPTQIGVRYMYPGVVLLLITAVVNRRYLIILIGFLITFTYNMLNSVWLGVGILYYPSKLMIWTPTQNALLATGLFVVYMVWFMRPVFSSSSINVVRERLFSNHPSHTP